MMVLDAGAVVAWLTRHPSARGLAARLEEPDLLVDVPQLLLVEVSNVLRKLIQRGELHPAHADQLMEIVRVLPFEVHDHAPLLARAWSWRANLSAYDAIYVALAEGLGATLVTSDARLARAVEGRVPVWVLGEQGIVPAL
jgi:predicted nucleic acid-binding protein